MSSDNDSIQANAAVDALQDSSPIKPKRTRKPKAAEGDAVLAPEAVAVAGELPAAKKTVRRKKVAEAPEAGESGVEPVAAEAPAVKPKRAPRKKVAAAEASEAAAADVAAPAAAPVESQPVAVAQPEPESLSATNGAVRESAAGGFLQLAPQTPEINAVPSGEASPAAEGEQGGATGQGRYADRQADGRGEGRGRRDRQRPGRGGDRYGEPRGLRASGPMGEGEGAEGAVPSEGGAVEGADQVPSRRSAMTAEQANEVFAGVWSGEFDKSTQDAEQAEGADATEATKRVLRPEPDAPKLQKVLAQSGVGSRRDIEQMIEDGQIEVNGEVAHIGQRISFGDQVRVAGRLIKVRIAPPPARILAYHKPVGEVVTHDDPQGRPTVFRNLPRLANGKWMSVGRLDLNTEGLLLFTNSGELANQLMHPRFGVEREYAVRVLGTLDEDARRRLLEGVEIEGQVAGFVSIQNGGGEGVNHWYRVVITEGRNREVRKLFDAVGLTVSRLIRVRYGAIVLPLGLKRGVWVELGESDVRAVKSLTGLDRGEGMGRGKGRHKSQQGSQHGSQQGGRHGKPGAQQNGRGPGPQQGRQGPGNFNPNAKPFRQGAPEPRSVARDGDEDWDDIGPIPNPLEQTFDRRFAKGSKKITSGFGRPDQDASRGGSQGDKKGPRQPDPMQTSVGYIGADAYFGKTGGGRSGRGGRGRR